MKKALVVRKPVSKTEISSPAEMIRIAVSEGADLDKLEKLLTLQERWEKNEALKAYNVAMSEFKKSPPEIAKDRTVAYGNTNYKHASLANVTKKINFGLSKHGLSASWKTQQNEAVQSIQVTCKITHVKGHSEETPLSAGADTSGSKNSIQAIGSTLTYLERYTLLALTGLATCEDDDGRASIAEYITEAEGNKILDLVTSTKSDLGRFLSYMKVEKLEQIAKGDYKKAIVALENKKNGKKK